MGRRAEMAELDYQGQSDQRKPLRANVGEVKEISRLVKRNEEEAKSVANEESGER